jgi:ubiquinone/menaquinone biosynthesis C-methylase UbiE
MRRPEFIARQSRCPSGVLGRLIGLIMSYETAAANDEALRELAVEPGDRVLEIGFGHGRAIERVALLVPEGFVAGIDTSHEMLRMALRRCARLIERGRVRLARGDSAAIPYPDDCFDKAFSIHTIYFWREPIVHLCEVRRVLREGGRLVLGFRPKADAGAADFPEDVYTFYAADDVRRLLGASGFSRVRLAAPSAVLVLATATA